MNTPDVSSDVKQDGCGCDVERMNRAQRRAHARLGGPHKAQAPERLTFEDAPTSTPLTFGAPGHTFQIDAAKRTIRGLAVPYGEPTFSEGARFQFARGVLQLPDDPSRIKLLVSHDRAQAVGKATQFTETDAGLDVTFSVARGPKGDEALSMAEDGVWDGLSIGLRDGAKSSTGEDGITHFSSAVLGEISLTPDPAFSTARVAAVVAHAPEGNTSVPCTICGQVHAEGMTCPGAPVAAAPAPAAVAPVVNVAAPAAFDYAALAAAFAQAIPAPAVIDPVPTAQFQVTEEGPYRFAAGMFREGGTHEFSADLQAGSKGDAIASGRALAFVQEQFAVAQTNVQSVLPTGQNRLPGTIVDRREYQYPLSEALRKGPLDNIAPFSFPRFNSLAGLVQDHTEGVEPVPGSLTTTSQTVTPRAMSGKVEITREVFDQASNPQLSNFIFSKMVRTYNEALEASIVTELTAQAAGITDITIPLAAQNNALVNALIGAIVDLQYIRGGYTFDLLATQIDLYKALATAVDTTGRNLAPVLGPANAVGTSARQAKTLDVDGINAIPVWSLAGTSVNRQNSWLIDSESVHLWNSAPQRLDFNFGATVQQISGTTGNLSQVAMVTIAIWGYRAVAVSDLGGVRQVTYDPISPES